MNCGTVDVAPYEVKQVTAPIVRTSWNKDDNRVEPADVWWLTGGGESRPATQSEIELQLRIIALESRKPTINTDEVNCKNALAFLAVAVGYVGEFDPALIFDFTRRRIANLEKQLNEARNTVTGISPADYNQACEATLTARRKEESIRVALKQIAEAVGYVGPFDLSTITKYIVDRVKVPRVRARRAKSSPKAKK